MKFLKPPPFSLARTPAILKSFNGDVVRYPPNASQPFNNFKGYVGLAAVKIFLEERDAVDSLRNKAQINYLNNRESLLKSYGGKWIAVSSNNSVFLDDYENVVRHIAEKAFRSVEEDYFMTCIGSEVLEMVDMGMGDLRFVGADEPREGERDDELYVCAAYSFSDLNNFIPTRMQLSTEASLMGVPTELLSDQTLQRGRDEIRKKLNGKEIKIKTYENIHIKVGETVITTRAIEANKWIIGYPVWSKFKISIDATKTPAVVMIPHDEKLQ